MLDLKALNRAIEQIAQERGIKPEAVLGAIEAAIATAYRKEYRKKGEIVKCKIDNKTGAMKFWQIKTVVDENSVRMKEKFEAETEEIIPLYNPDRHILIEEAKKKNVSLLQAETNINIRKYDLKVNRSSFLPKLGVSGSYNWAEFQNNSSAFLQTQETYGFSGTATLSWSIFNGADINRVKNAKIAIENEEIRKKQAEQQVVRDVSNAFETYENQLYVLQTQEKNLQTNKRNFQRSEEQFKLGQITSIDFRTAQINLINAKVSRDTAKFDAKLAEINLLQLSGKLLDVEF